MKLDFYEKYLVQNLNNSKCVTVQIHTNFGCMIFAKYTSTYGMIN